MDEYVAKPFNPSDLESRLTALAPAWVPIRCPAGLRAGCLPVPRVTAWRSW